MIVDGWLDKAIKLPGRVPVFDGKSGFNPGTNGVRGLIFHSAEGWATTMLDARSQWGYYSAEFPWHFSNLLDGRLFQHYPLTLRCWHGSAFNQDYCGIEHEGVSPHPGKGPLLNAAQIENDRLIIAEVSAWKGWRPKRPLYVTDLTATLYEHKETVWFGGTSTSCPNNRIPWDLILQPAQEDDDMFTRWNGEANPTYWSGKQLSGASGFGVRSDFLLPDRAKSVEIEVFLRSGGLTAMDGGSTGRAGYIEGPGNGRVRMFLDKDGNAWFDAEPGTVVDKLLCLGWYS